MNTLACCSCGNQLWDGTKYKLLDKCKVCGLVRAKEIPSEKELRDYYKQDYYFGQEYIDYVQDQQALEVNFKDRVKTLRNMSKKKKNLHVLELGSAYGFFLNLIKPYSSHTLGFEMSREGVDYANEHFDVNTTDKPFLDTPIEEGTYDIAVLWDVIEHVRDPEAYVGKLVDSLKPGGLLALTTGDISAWLAKMRGDNWRMIHPPTHLYYFDPHTAGILLERLGMTVELVDWRPHYRNMASVLGQLRINRLSNKRGTGLIDAGTKVAEATKLTKLNFGVNTRDIMLVVARKNER